MSLRTSLLAGLALAALSPAAAAQKLTIVNDFEAHCLATGFGLSLGGESGFQAAIHSGGLITPFPGARRIRAASFDGSVRVGEANGTQALEPVRWTQATGWQPLPQPAGIVGTYGLAFGLSDDGDTACGQSFGGDPDDPHYVAWRWTASGGTAWLSDPDTTLSSAYCVSGDGNKIGGALAVLGVTGSRATIWEGGQPSEVFTPGMEGYGGVSQHWLLNHDGTKGAGRVWNLAYVWDKVGGPTILPRPDGFPEFWNMIPKGMSDDGSLVVGDFLTTGDGGSWVWIEGQGTRAVADLASQLMLGESGDIPFQFAADCRGDGLVLVGQQPDGGATDSWMLELPAGGVGQILDLGFTLAGAFKPRLEAFGALAAGTAARVELSDAAPVAVGTFVVGLSRIDQPLKGGVLVPFPDVLIDVTTLGDGTFDLAFVWPQDVPAGFSTYVQAWVKDGGAPKGFAASNALELLAP